MRYFVTASLVAFAAPALVSAAPVRARAASQNDLTVLKFADVLENLESQFYSQALSKFQNSDFTSAGFNDPNVPIQQFTVIQKDESTHATVLEQTIKDVGGQPISGCNFDFSKVLTDVSTMAATARVVENVGVSAYLGAAHLVDDPVLLTAAGSILTVEARHQTVLNMFASGSSAIPQAFDIALTPSEVLAVAGPFVSGCDLGIPANPSLALTNTGTVGVGTKLEFSSSAIKGSLSDLTCQMIVGGAPMAITFAADNCVVPQGINGPVALFLTNDSQPLANDVVQRATSQLVAGPALAFIDSVQEALPALVKSGSSSSSSNNNGNSGSSSSSSTQAANPLSTSVSTTTISGQDASSILSAASTTLTASGSSSTDSSGSSASATSSGSSSAPTGASNNAAGGSVNSSLANLNKGPSPDGHTDVLGWTGI